MVPGAEDEVGVLEAVLEVVWALAPAGALPNSGASSASGGAPKSSLAGRDSASITTCGFWDEAAIEPDLTCV